MYVNHDRTTRKHKRPNPQSGYASNVFINSLAQPWIPWQQPYLVAWWWNQHKLEIKSSHIYDTYRLKNSDQVGIQDIVCADALCFQASYSATVFRRQLGPSDYLMNITASQSWLEWLLHFRMTCRRGSIMQLLHCCCVILYIYIYIYINVYIPGEYVS